MEISGFEKLTLTDYPGKVACIVFTQGCNFKCPFCHNSDLIKFKEGEILEKDVLDYIDKRKNMLDGVVITGGEPTMQRDLISFLKQIKDLGLNIKLDTNGVKPDVLEKIIKLKLVDYIAMDIKSDKENYSLVSGVKVEFKNIDKSVNLIKNSDVEFEFRTTVIKNYHSYETLLKIEPGLSKYFTTLNSSHDLLKMALLYFNKLIDIHISEENNIYNAKVKITNGRMITIIDFIKKEKESIVKITKEKLNQGFITDYTVDIYCYDEEYRSKENPDKMKEILKDFSTLFYIPEELALFFYQNFNKYYMELNKQRILSEMKLEQLTRPDKEQYSFTRPMSLNELKKVWTITDPNFQKINILEALKRNIVEPKVVFANPLFKEILKYYAGMNAGIIDTSGIIIGKNEETYSKYYVWIKSDKIEILREQISKERAQELFYLSENNLDNDYLKEFFGFFKSR